MAVDTSGHKDICSLPALSKVRLFTLKKICLVLSSFHACVGDHYKKAQQRNTIGLMAPWIGSIVCLLVGCLTSQQQASVSQGRICSDNYTCCHTEIEAADQTFYLTQSQYTDTGPTSASTDPITPDAGGVAIGVPIFKSLV